jgi:hypothetical protein
MSLQEQSYEARNLIYDEIRNVSATLITSLDSPKRTIDAYGKQHLTGVLTMNVPKLTHHGNEYVDPSNAIFDIGPPESQNTRFAVFVSQLV